MRTIKADLTESSDPSYDIVTRGCIYPPGGYWPPVGVVGSVASQSQKPSLLFTRLEVKDSTSDPAWSVRKTAYTLVRPKKSRKFDLKGYLKEPVKPRYNPPRWIYFNSPPLRKELKVYPFTPPTKKESWSQELYVLLTLEKWKRYESHVTLLRERSESNYQARYNHWVARQEAYLRKLESYEIHFKSRMAKYERRLAILERRKAIVSNWKRRPPLRFARPTKELTEHYYRRDTIVADGAPLRLVAYSRWPWNYYPSVAPISCSGAIASVTNTYTRLGIAAGDSWEGGSAWANAPIGTYFEVAFAGYHTGIERAVESLKTELDNKVVTKILSKVRKGDLHLANIIGERVQTFNMLRDAVKRLSDLATGKKRLIKGVVSFIKNPRLIANDYLAFKFGVEPLLSDVQKAAETLAEHDLGEDTGTLTFRANNKRVLSNVVVSLGDGEYVINGEMEISYVLRYTISSDFARWASRLGFVNPLEVAWELMPWSFIVDWMLPVQNWLESLTNDVGLDFKTGTKKYRLLYTIKRVNSNPGSSSLLTTVEGGGGFGSLHGELFGNHVRELKLRTVLTEPPSVVPPKAFAKDPITQTHVFESLALIVQKLFKR